jgi:dihydropteroate synthase
LKSFPSWQSTRFAIDLAEPKVMGIVNVTPDSFSDGGRHLSTRMALAHCEKLLEDGAHILDIGGESSRPGAQLLPLQEELARVVPVVREAVTLGVPISVDTYKPQVMQAVLDLGADIINDIRALQWRANPDNPDDSLDAVPHALQVVSRHPQCGVCLMHMHRDPQTMQVMPMEGDVVPQILLFWEHCIKQLQELGVNVSRIVLDPGIGFGKTVAQNFELLARQGELLSVGHPLLLGWSRKSSLASPPGSSQASLAVGDRMIPSVAAALLAVERGATIVRVHDVRETIQALKVWGAARLAPVRQMAEQSAG